MFFVESGYIVVFVWVVLELAVARGCVGDAGARTLRTRMEFIDCHAYEVPKVSDITFYCS